MFLGRWRRRGQSTTEYILIVVLVAVLSVSTERLGGDDNATLDSSITSQAQGQVRKSMADLKGP